MDKQPIRGD